MTLTCKRCSRQSTVPTMRQGKVVIELVPCVDRHCMQCGITTRHFASLQDIQTSPLEQLPHKVS